jgi:uncharacterized protein YutE (UPF0331/DUF86 family)
VVSAEPCYRLLVGIEAALSLCHHIAAKHLRRVPEEYAACFGSLQGAGVIDAALAPPRVRLTTPIRRP